MDRVLHMKTFGMRIRVTEKAGARVTGIHRCQEVAIDMIRFSMGDPRNTLHTHWGRCLDRLTKPLLFLQQEEKLPILHLDRLFGNPSDLTEGRSFLEDERNEEVLGRLSRPDGKGVESRMWSWSLAMREDRMTKHFLHIIEMSEVRDGSELQWNTIKEEQYPMKAPTRTLRAWRDTTLNEVKITCTLLSSNASFGFGLYLMAWCSRVLSVAAVESPAYLFAKVLFAALLNDHIFDIYNQTLSLKEDTVNEPDRPIPAGLLGVQGAYW